MSVTTEADRCLDNAKESTQSAVENLSKIIVDKVWGHDDWNDVYSNNMKKAWMLLMEARDLLG